MIYLNFKKVLLCFVCLVTNVLLSQNKAIKSITTKHTVLKVNTANFNHQSNIITSSYNGVVSAYNYKGDELWEKALSGLMNHDVWTDDIDNDGNEEVLLANADGSIYCLNYQGKLLWNFKLNDSPMISVCVVHPKKGELPYIACGGNDLNIYYISNQGKLLQTIPSSSYKTPLKPNKVWQDDGTLPYNVHTVNFLRPLQQPDGSDILLLNGVLSHADKWNLFFYFKPNQIKPFKYKKVFLAPLGDINITNNPITNSQEILVGASGIVEKLDLGILNPMNHQVQKVRFSKNIHKSLGFGYRVAQTELISQNKEHFYATLMGEYMFITNTAKLESTEAIKTTFSYNDIHKDNVQEKLILASAQSGGNQIHIIDYSNPKWKKEYKNLIPQGNIASILEGTKTVKKQLQTYQKASWEKDPTKVHFMSPPSRYKSTKEMLRIRDTYKNLSFMGYAFLKDVGKWDRSSLEVNSFKEIKDVRKKYISSPEKIQQQLISKYTDEGLCTWGGHGVDPYYYGKNTIQKVIKAGKGKPSVWVWPELTILHKKNFKYALDNLIYPLSTFSKSNNAKQFIRSKHTFWQSYIYKPEWSRFLSGEFADVFIPSMEETQDVAMELSLAGRLGLWSSGVANDWGTRCARDNPSFMRSRQFSHQNLPNHFLRNSIFHLAYGAKYVNNFNIDSKYSDYMSLLWELIGTGALYVPEKNEILSFSPVHVSVNKPDERYLREGNSSSTTLRYDEAYQKENPFVFGRLSSDWTGAQNTEWDFSTYAAGVKDKRLNFLAPYNNGLVLITPVQNGVLKQKNAFRKPLKENLHPLYKNILTEYITNGKDYISADGTQKLKASKYYKKVAKSIKDKAKLLPITVTGKAAWVVAQSSPKHLRLTLIDGGYLNPKEKEITVKFNTVKPVKVIDILSKEKFKCPNKKGELKITIPCGMFRFIDVELAKAL